MWIYYQTQEDGKQTWTVADEQEEKALREGPAYHMSIYKVDKIVDAESVNSQDLRYKGDLWIDIDHKPSVENPTPSDYDDALNRAISDVRKLIEWMATVRINPSHCRYYATGSKGFHILIPSYIVGAPKAYKDLPKIHKIMAQQIMADSGAEGIDMQLYCVGKGKLLRVENKQRSNGKYKVLLTLDEVNNVTPDKYRDLTASARIGFFPAIEKGPVSTALAIMFEDAKDTVGDIRKIPFNAATTEEMANFVEAYPKCIEWLVSTQNIHEKADKFNLAKMSLTRFLNSAPLNHNVRSQLISDMANNWKSDSNKTSAARTRAIQSAMRSESDFGFDCGYMKRTFTESPCGGCAMNKVENRPLFVDQNSEIVATTSGYVVNTDKPKQITNFILEAKEKAVLVGHNANKTDYETITFDLFLSYEGDKPAASGRLTLDRHVWISSREFKQQIAGLAGLWYVGSDNELQKLGAMLTDSRNDNGLKIVKNIETLGIYKLDDEVTCWVEPGYSIGNNHLKNLVSFKGKKFGINGDMDYVTLKMEDVGLVDPDDASFNHAFKCLLDVNEPKILAPILGWLSSCWLKEYLQRGSDRQFPFLQVYGEAGIGKTETTALLSMLGGADYRFASPMAISQSTPFAIMTEGSLTTTVPRIFDEVNPTKIGDKNKYHTTREVVKASASGGSMKQGRVNSKEVMLDSRVMTSPIITLATNESNEAEWKDRSILVAMLKGEKDKGTHTESFEFLRDNPELIYPFIKAMMTAAIAKGREDWAWDKYKQNAEEVNRKDRPKKSWSIVLTGMDFMIEVMIMNFIRQDLIDQAKALREVLVVMANTVDDSTRRSAMTEAEIAIDRISSMATIEDQGQVGKFMLRRGVHFNTEGDLLHLFLPGIFLPYKRMLREAGATIEYAEVGNLRAAIEQSSWYVGQGMAKGVAVPSDWVTLDMRKLEERSVKVERFKNV